MNKIKFIIKLSPEITIKSTPVRKRTVKMLSNNISKTLNSENIDFNLSSNWDNISLDFKNENDYEKILDILKNIFWIHSILETKEFSFETLDDILKIVWDFYKDKLDGLKIFVKAKRNWNHDFSSKDVERIVWWHLLKNSKNASVSLSNADKIISLEIKDKKLYIINQKITGQWWYPIWFSWKVLSLISGWFDSTVSTYMSMKRGLEVDYLFFDLWFKPHEIAVKQISYYLWKNFSKSYKSTFIKIDFQFLVNLLLTNSTPKYRSVLLKRYMLKTTDLINDYLLKNVSFFKDEYQAIVKWDSLAQVSSQTLANLTNIDKACEMLVLRPLVMFDKQDIINITKQIWTYEFCQSIPEYCSVVSLSPTTKSQMEVILQEEKKIDEIFYKEVLKNIEVKKIIDVLDFENSDFEIKITQEIAKDDVIIDIREKEIILKKPLKIDGNTILNIPFFEINSKFESLDKDKNYLLYCEKWVLSKLHYLYLKDKWYNNLAVYRPE